MSIGCFFDHRSCNNGILLLGLLTACGGYAHDADYTEFDQVQQPVQRNYVVFSQTSTANWVNLLYSESMSLTGKSMGALYGINSSQWYGFNCGVTFISPQYAVTAAHCVMPPLFGNASGSFSTTRRI